VTVRKQIWKTNLKVVLRGSVGQRVGLQHQLGDEHGSAAARFRLKKTNTDLYVLQKPLDWYSDDRGFTGNNTTIHTSWLASLSAGSTSELRLQLWMKAWLGVCRTCSWSAASSVATVFTTRACKVFATMWSTRRTKLGKWGAEKRRFGLMWWICHKTLYLFIFTA